MGTTKTRTTTARTTRSPREEGELATRRAILDAAARAFVQSGYGAATMRAVAAEAGLAASSLYGYFKGKEELFEALRQDCHGEMLDVLDRPLPEGLSFEQRLELLMMRQCEVVQSRLESYIYLSFMGGAESAEHAEQLEYIDRMVAWISANGSAEELAGHPAEDVAYFLFGVQHGSFAQWLRTGAATPLRDQIPKILRLLMRGLS